MGHALNLVTSDTNERPIRTGLLRGGGGGEGYFHSFSIISFSIRNEFAFKNKSELPTAPSIS